MALWNQPAQEGSSDKSPGQPPPASAQSVVPVLNPVVREPNSKARSVSVFGPGVTIEGKIEGDADIRIVGKFKGEIQINGDLTIEKGATVHAKVNATNMSLGGELNGNVVAGAHVTLLESGQLLGDLKAATLTVAAGSRMRGHVEFGWSPAEASKLSSSQSHDSDKSVKSDPLLNPL